MPDETNKKLIIGVDGKWNQKFSVCLSLIHLRNILPLLNYKVITAKLQLWIQFKKKIICTFHCSLQQPGFLITENTHQALAIECR